jgi:hypothetical protein
MGYQMTKEKRSSAEEKERHIYHQKLKQLEQLRWKEIEELDAEDINSRCGVNHETEGPSLP